MRVIRFGDGTRFGNINARWGNPSYVLEPGDDGYRVPPPLDGPILEPKPTIHHMSTNATPNNRSILLAVARGIHAGQLTHADSVGLLHHLPAGMDAGIKKLEGDPAAGPGSAANKGSQLVYRETINATGNAESAYQKLSDITMKPWLDGYRKVMEGIHGKKANAGWEAAGFAQGSTAVPRNHDLRLTLLGAARAYLGAHETYQTTLPQKTGPGLAITAAQALAHQTAMQAAKNLINSLTAVQAEAKGARDADVEALYQEVSGTTNELSDLLGPTDPRWEIFGLNIPAKPNPPLGVASLTVTSAGASRELAEWPYAVRADYFRVMLLRVGIDTEPVNVGDAHDLEFTLKNLTPGTTIEVTVIPMNEGGAGPASPKVTKVVGA